MCCDFILRRETLLNAMTNNSAAVFFSAPEVTRSNDTHYPYRQNSDFWYLTEFSEPGAVLVLIKHSTTQYQSILFNRSKDPLAETWTGYRLGQEEALSKIHVDIAYSLDDITTMLPKLINGLSALYHASQLYSYADQIIDDVMRTLRQGIRSGYQAPHSLIDWRPILHSMRQIKSDHEITLIRKAANISALGHVRAMKHCAPGLYEYQLESEILHEFTQHGARMPAYNTIVGGGINGCILHYENNSEILKEGDLVLIDAGCEYQHYAGDITRTFPVNGQFTPEQKDIYDLVLASQMQAISQLKPGISIREVNEQVIKIMLEGLLQLNIIKGSIDQLIEEKAHTPFYMHGLGHGLGIDVHDVCHPDISSSEQKLASGMIITVEPGLYFNQHANVPSAYKGIGIRIEDDILITENGNEVLTSHVPKIPSEIETLMKSG